MNEQNPQPEAQTKTTAKVKGKRGRKPGVSPQFSQTVARKRAMVAAYAETGIVGAALEASGADRASHYKWLKDDPYYKQAMEHAADQAADALEKEVRRRAREGVRKFVTYQGKVVMVLRDMTKPEGPDNPKVPLVEHYYSDVLALATLKANRPDKWRERQSIDLTSGGQPLYKVLPVEVEAAL